MSASTVTFHRLYGCLCSITIKHELRKSVELANVWNKEKAPVLGDRGLTDRRRGVGGCGDYLPSELGRWRLRCRCLLIQSPRITTLLQLRDGVIGDRKSLLLVSPSFRPRMIFRERLSAKAMAYRRISPLVLAQQNIYRTRCKPLHFVGLGKGRPSDLRSRSRRGPNF